MKIRSTQLQLISYYREAQSQLRELQAVVEKVKTPEISAHSSHSYKEERAQAVILSRSLKALLELQEIKRSELEQKRSKKIKK